MRARALGLAAVLVGCGGHAPLFVEPPLPAARVAAVEAHEWEEACAGDPRLRVSHFANLAVRDARARGDDAEEHALLRWAPRSEAGDAGQVAIEDRAHVVPVVRRVIETCGLDEAIALTETLVGFQTIAAIAPPAEHEEFQRMARTLSAWAEDARLRFVVSGAHDAWEIVLPGAEGAERRLSLVVHGDVVPVNDPPAIIEPAAIPAGWTHAPFTAERVGERLYGRGTEDDKGPMAAILVVLATLRDAGLVPDGDVVLAVGLSEEEEWDPMRRYAESAPRARHVISVDASFPVVAAQSGFVAWGLETTTRPGRAARAERRAVALEASGGLFLTQIPDAATLRVRPPRGARGYAATVQAAIDAELAARADAAYSASVSEVEGAVVIDAHGRSTHSSTAEDGRNALWLLAGIASRLELADGPVPRMLRIVHERFDGDHTGARLGLTYSDELMGTLLVAPTRLRTEGGVVRLEVNMRRPVGRTSEEFRGALTLAAQGLDAPYGGVREISDVYVGEPHVADPSGTLVPTLMGIWRDVTGIADAQPIAIRGGTYARLFPGAVDFGPALPGHPYTGHGADEHIELGALSTTVRTTLESVLALSMEP